MGRSPLSTYWKGILAAATAIAVTVVQVIQSQGALGGHWTVENTLAVALAALGAVSVYLKSNDPPNTRAN